MTSKNFCNTKNLEPILGIIKFFFKLYIIRLTQTQKSHKTTGRWAGGLEVYSLYLERCFVLKKKRYKNEMYHLQIHMWAFLLSLSYVLFYYYYFYISTLITTVFVQQLYSYR